MDSVVGRLGGSLRRSPARAEFGMPMTLALLLVFLGLGIVTSLGMVVVAALMILEGP